MILPPPRCMLCGDAAVAARVVRVDGDEGVLEDGETVDLELVDDVGAGDLVLCHAGVALQVLEER